MSNMLYACSILYVPTLHHLVKWIVNHSYICHLPFSRIFKMKYTLQWKL
jgi:hypothetical protein